MSASTSPDATGAPTRSGGLVIEDLGVKLTGREVDVVDDIDLVLRPGEVVGLVGESGSGKTTVGTSLLGYSRAGAIISSGKVLLEDRDILSLDWRQVRQLRGEAGARQVDGAEVACVNATGGWFTSTSTVILGTT